MLRSMIELLAYVTVLQHWLYSLSLCKNDSTEFRGLAANTGFNPGFLGLKCLKQHFMIMSFLEILTLSCAQAPN